MRYLTLRDKNLTEFGPSIPIKNLTEFSDHFTTDFMKKLTYITQCSGFHKFLT